MNNLISWQEILSQLSNKKDLTFRKFKFEDPKVARQLGLPKTMMEFHLQPRHVLIFLTKQEDN